MDMLPKKIPASFILAGRTWKVKRKVRATKWYGRTYAHKCLIELSTANKSHEEELHTFFHELLHATASAMGWEKFNKDEPKIDAMAALLLQAFMTQK